MQFPAYGNNFQVQHVSLLCDSYHKLLGSELMARKAAYSSLAETVFKAPLAVVSHNTAEDPLFNYANLKALELFGFGWDEFTALPSRLSAEPIHRDERERVLMEVSQNGYIRNYCGVRINKSGRRFLISNADVWNLYDNDGRYAGQAACFDEWRFID